MIFGKKRDVMVGVSLKSSMNYLHTLKTAWSGIWVNKARSSLTILGIVIGVTAIILIVSIGEGAEKLILKQIQGLGADMVVLRPGQEPSGPTDFADTLFSDSVGEKEVDALLRKENVPDVAAVAPAVMVSGSVSYQGETYRPMMLGWDADFMARIMDVYPEKGVLFDEIDIKQRAKVVIIGTKVKEELFGDEEALGKNVKIKDHNFRVVAVLPKKGKTMLMDVDSVLVMPYTTAQTYLAGINHYHEVMIRISSPDLVDKAVSDIEITMRELHDITDPDKDDFYVESSQGLVEQIGIILSVLTLFLSSVVAISLVVGGIGVMNIMLVTVTERTREIGLRKALGATTGNIMSQFLIEAVTLTVMGGIIGIILGVLLGMVAAVILSNSLNSAWEFTFPVNAALLGVAVSMGVGLVFGLYPARKASRKSPIEALRYE